MAVAVRQRAAPGPAEAPREPRPARELRRDLRNTLRNAPLLIGLAGVLAIAVVALLGPQLAPHDPYREQTLVFYPDGSYETAPVPPDRYYWLGTDPLGRDILSRLLWGARLTLGATLLGVAGRAALGLLVGLLAGWRRGWLDLLAVYVTNAFAGLPQLLLALLLVVALRDLGFLGWAIALALVGWAEIAQFVRAEVIRLRGAPYVEAARALGADDRRLVSRHVLGSLAPQLVGLLAVEAGSVLLLLAELGFVGVFISGGTFFTNDAGLPVLPVRDRAAEWGQMLAGARSYAFTQQWVAFVPAVVVGLAVVAFNLLGEGVRGAIDPFGARRLSPRSLAIAGRGLLAAALVGVVTVTAMTVQNRAGSLELAEGLELARQTAARVAPDAQPIAAVVRFSSGAYALSRPEKLNYYFRAPSQGGVLRVGFPGADPNAVEVQMHHNDDKLDWERLRPLGDWRLPWQEALAFGERRGGAAFRSAGSAYLTQIVLEQREGWSSPVYRVLYRTGLGSVPTVQVAVDASAETAEFALEAYRADAEARARAELGPGAALVGKAATWHNASLAVQGDEGPMPQALQFAFSAMAASADPKPALLVAYEPRHGFEARLERLPAPRLPAGPLPADVVGLAGAEASLGELFRLVEQSGGQALRAQWATEGDRLWTAHGSVYTTADGETVVEFTYLTQPLSGPRRSAQFRVDLATGEVTRVR